MWLLNRGAGPGSRIDPVRNGVATVVIGSYSQHLRENQGGSAQKEWRVQYLLQLQLKIFRELADVNSDKGLPFHSNVADVRDHVRDPRVCQLKMSSAPTVDLLLVQ